MNTCRICLNTVGNKTYLAHEMMFGMQDEFEYFECARCGCLQIKTIPKEMSKYYPRNYYSFQIPKNKVDNAIIASLKKLRINLTVINPITSKLLEWTYRNKRADHRFKWIKKSGIKLDSKILDVGSGTGGVLIKLRRDGFKNLLGIDPFIKKDISLDQNIKVLKKNLSEIDGQFDFIMLHHSFEHMEDPKEVFKQIDRLLKPNRFCIIRIPVVGSFAWRTYGVNWVGLDAPRHFYLHTPRSIKILADQTSLRLDNTIFDSSEFQFWGSEQYEKRISFMSPTSHFQNPEKSIFSKKQIKAYNAKARELNKKGDGDCACFFLRKKHIHE